MSVLFNALAKAAEANMARRRPFVAGSLEISENAVLSRKPASHSAMWRALEAAAAEPLATRSLPPSLASRPAPRSRPAPPTPPPPPRPVAPPPPQAAYAPPEPQAPPQPRFSAEGLKRLGDLGARLRTSETFGKPSPRPFRIALLVLVTALGGTLGALYYFGDDTLAIYEELMGEEPVRRPPPPRKPQQVAQAPKEEAPQQDAQPVPQPEPAKEEKVAETPVPEAAPAPLPVTPEPKPAPAVSAADAALDRVIAETGRKAAQEKEIADKAATDLPGVLAEVRNRKAQGAVTPQIEVRKASGMPSVAATGTDSKIDMVRMPTISAQVRDTSEEAYTRLLSGQYEGAALLYADVLKREPRNLSALTGRAAALHKLGQYGEARQLYQQALAINPGNREVLSNLMSIYGTEDPRDALRQLEMLAQDNPGYSPIPAQMATLYAQNGDLASAIRYQGQAVQLAPENLLYRLNLAVMQDRAGMGPEAANSYETVLALASRGSVASLPMPVGQVRERLSYLRTR